MIVLNLRPHIKAAVTLAYKPFTIPVADITNFFFQITYTEPYLTCSTVCIYISYSVE